MESREPFPVCTVRHCQASGTERREFTLPSYGDDLVVTLWYCPEHYVRVLAFKASGGRWAA